MIHSSGSPVPFFRPAIGDDEVDAVVRSLRSGWLTTGPNVKRFETDFAAAVGAKNAVALNSCTAALHLAVEALGLAPGDRVLVPTMTFAATAEVVRYCGGVPILVDCDPVTLHLDLDDARGKIDRFGPAVGVIPVHVAGHMMDLDRVEAFARDSGLWIVEDGAHAFPAAFRQRTGAPWRRCGEGTAGVSCFSFYANKTITTGEGGMAVTEDDAVAERMRRMSLHGLSRDAWGRYTGGGSWDYRIVAPGYKYNMTDLAAAIGVAQLAKAEPMRIEREAIARRYLGELSAVDEIELPADPADRIHSWHLFIVRLRLESLSISRAQFLEELGSRGIGTSVHWRPLHLHPYYREALGWRADDCPRAAEVFERIVSLPIFPGMSDREVDRVVSSVSEVCAKNRRMSLASARA